jgi:hypothetical protein
MNKSETISNIAKAMAIFQAEVKNPANTADNPFFKSKYAPLPDILNDVRPLLTKNGLSIIQSPSGDGSNIIITTMIMHASGEWIELDPLVLKADKTTAQGAGSAITYGRRYALSSLCGISSEDDDDGNHASKEDKPKTPPKAPQQGELTEGQLKRLFAISKQANKSTDEVKKLMLEKFNKDSSKLLTKKEYDELCKILESK